jgi:redox-sensitive bicupin YhaK (pirin superfamily)
VAPDWLLSALVPDRTAGGRVTEGAAVQIDVRRNGDRFVSRAEGIVSRHSFSFGPHYDPANTAFGCLVANNDDVLSPGAGFPEHPHRDLEIVSWVLTGALQHRDSEGGSAVLRPGMVGRLSTGSGVQHAETNALAGETRYVQMWLLPDAEGSASYDTADVSAALGAGGFVVVASGIPLAPVRLRRAGPTFLVARIAAGASAVIPAAPLLHVYVAVGAVALDLDEPAALAEGDAVRIAEAAPVRVEAVADAEVLVWAMF